MTRTEQESRRRETIYESMYCASPLPKDQFSHETWTRLMSRSSGRSLGDSDKISAKLFSGPESPRSREPVSIYEHTQSCPEMSPDQAR
jgi:hypothetical protein